MSHKAFKTKALGYSNIEFALPICCQRACCCTAQVRLQTLVAENDELRMTVDRLQGELAQVVARHNDQLEALRQHSARTIAAEAKRCSQESTEILELETQVHQLEGLLRSSDAKHAGEIQVMIDDFYWSLRLTHWSSVPGAGWSTT